MGKITAIVLAGGTGKRMGGETPKQFLMLAKRPLLYYSLKAFENSNVDEVILVVSPSTHERAQELVNTYELRKVSKLVDGGAERYDSVYAGLVACSDTEYVHIHDGARPFVTPEMIDEMSARVKECDALIAAVPVKDTIKIVSEEGVVRGTPARSSLYQIQTPQSFLYSEILASYKMMITLPHESVTDDAMVEETYGKIPVQIYESSYLNFKVTTPDDLLFAEAVMRRKKTVKKS